MSRSSDQKSDAASSRSLWYFMVLISHATFKASSTVFGADRRHAARCQLPTRCLMMTQIVRPAHFPLTGRGLTPIRSISPGDALLRIPFSRLLTNRDTVARFPSSAGLPELASLALILSWHRFLGPESNRKNYIAALPTDFEGWPVTWPAESLALLPAELRVAVLAQRTLLESHWNLAQECIDNEEFRTFAKDDWTKSWLLANSRCLSVTFPPHPNLRTTMALAPLFDMFNHTFDSGSSIDCDQQTQEVIVRAGRAWEPGEEAFITYGPHDSAFLLVEYGFVVPENPYDSVNVDKELESFLGERRLERCIEWLKEEGFRGDAVVSSDGIGYRLEVAAELVQSIVRCNGSTKEEERSRDTWKRRVRGLGGPIETDRAVLRTLLDRRLQRAREDLRRLDGAVETYPQLGVVLDMVGIDVKILEKALES